MQHIQPSEQTLRPCKTKDRQLLQINGRDAQPEGAARRLPCADIHMRLQIGQKIGLFIGLTVSRQEFQLRFFCR
ncbi:hypothetical protein D3C75_1044030 [compost metagenome]